MTRALFLFALFIFISNSSFSQKPKVKLKKGTIYLNDEEFLSYERRSNAMEFVVFELNTENELFTCIFYKGDRDIQNDSYNRLIFTESEKSMEYSTGYWNKSLIKWLLEQKLITSEGKLAQDKIDGFIKKFDEDITERTLR